MASTTSHCPCAPPCAFFSECPASFTCNTSGLTEQYNQLRLADEDDVCAEPKSIRTQLGRPCHNFPDQYTTIDTETPMPVLASEVPKIKITDEEGDLRDIQQKEEYLIEKYTEVFDMLDKKFRSLEDELKWNTKNGFEESVVRAVMASVGECMGMNEVAMMEGRSLIWEGYNDNDEIQQGSVVENQSKEEKKKIHSAGEIKENTTSVKAAEAVGEGEWERV